MSAKTEQESLTQESLRELLRYDPDTGLFFNLRGRRGYRVGDQVGWQVSEGYIAIRILGKQYKAHRLAWLYVHAKWPSNDIDHINRVRNDNRIANLRDATRSQNLQNASPRSDNKSGVTGVWWDKRLSKWSAGIRLDGRTKHLGRFNTKEDAIAARLRAEKEFHPFRIPQHATPACSLIKQNHDIDPPTTTEGQP